MSAMDEAPPAKEAVVVSKAAEAMDEAQPVQKADVVSKAAEAIDASDKDLKKTENAEVKNEEKSPVDDRDRAWDKTDQKVMVYGMMKYVKARDIQKMTKSWLEKLEDPDSIKFANVKKPPKDPWLKITLEKEEMVQPFLDLFEKHTFTNKKGGRLLAKRADTKAEIRDNKKRGADDRDARPQDAKRMKKAPKTADEVRDSTTPLWRESYEKQIDNKQRDMVMKCAMKIVKETKNKFRTLEREARRNRDHPNHKSPIELYDWLKQQRPIELEQVLPSPQHFEYRNKSEFTFGHLHELPPIDEAAGIKTVDDQIENMKKTPAVGFMASGWSGGVSHPHACQNIPSEACTIADIVNEFLSTCPIPPYDSKEHVGLWRTITIRTSKRTGECMIIIVHAPASGGIGAKEDGSDDYSDVFESEKKRLVDMLKDKELGKCQRDYPDVSKPDDIEEGNKEESENKEELEIEGTGKNDSASGKPIRVTSIIFQEYGGLSIPPVDHPVQYAFGKKVLHEKLGKCTFQISPGAFFQVNTEGAETLYNVVVQKVKEVSEKPEETLLFDVCCGTGTIGLTCMKEGVVGRVIGVDISQPAIEDAKLNAELNGYTTKDDDADQKTKFIASPAEHVLGKELSKVKDSSLSIVAVVDPAREGLHPDVVKAIRANEKIQRLVYVSCNPTKTLVQDAALLCQPPTKKYSGQPFKPVSAQPVDMFPLTTHCEMVMTFDRLVTSDN